MINVKEIIAIFVGGTIGMFLSVLETPSMIVILPSVLMLGVLLSYKYYIKQVVMNGNQM